LIRVSILERPVQTSVQRCPFGNPENFDFVATAPEGALRMDALGGIAEQAAEKYQPLNGRLNGNELRDTCSGTLIQIKWG